MFTSRREQRLWVLAAVVLVAIVLSLGFAGALAEALGDGPLAGWVFALGALAVLVGIVGLAVGFVRPSLTTVGVVVGIGAVYGLLFARMAAAAERTHLVEYGLLAALVYLALDERSRNGGGPPRPALLAVVIGSMVGIVDELIQAVLPARVFDVRDIAFNALASVLAVVAITAIKRTAGR